MRILASVPSKHPSKTPCSVASIAVTLEATSEEFSSPVSGCQHSILFSGRSSTVTPSEFLATIRTPSLRKVMHEIVSTSSAAAGESCKISSDSLSKSTFPFSSATAQVPSSEQAISSGNWHSVEASKSPSVDRSRSLSEDSATRTPFGCVHIVSQPESIVYSHRGLPWKAITPPLLVAAIT